MRLTADNDIVVMIVECCLRFMMDLTILGDRNGFDAASDRVNNFPKLHSYRRVPSFVAVRDMERTPFCHFQVDKLTLSSILHPKDHSRFLREKCGEARKEGVVHAGKAD